MPFDLSDEELMLAVRKGDVDKLAALFARYRARLYAFFSQMNGSTAASEDLVQDVFCRILKYRKTFREGASFRKWMYQIARNARIQYLEKHRPVSVDSLGGISLHESDFSPGHLFERHQHIVLLECALRGLPEDRRELLVLARYQEMKYQEIAELLEIDEGAVKVRVHRAMKELRDNFRTLCDGEKLCSVKKREGTLRTT
jgi:RNA polymerase sigma-70 factor (ECF subfamily)